jgi:hypothetical protein
MKKCSERGETPGRRELNPAEDHPLGSLLTSFVVLIRAQLAADSSPGSGRNEFAAR